LVPGANPKDYRTAFYPSPMTSRTVPQLAHARFLAQKITMLVQSFRVPEAGSVIRITPSLFEEACLEERAIPYYYRLNTENPIYRSWNHRLHEQGRDTGNYSYHAPAYSQGAAANPLASQIGRFSFFRVEGCLGQEVSDAVKQLETEIQAKNLPFMVRAVLLGTERSAVVKKPVIRYTDLHRFHYLVRKDLVSQLDDTIQFSTDFQHEAAKHP